MHNKADKIPDEAVKNKVKLVAIWHRLVHFYKQHHKQLSLTNQAASECSVHYADYSKICKYLVSSQKLTAQSTTRD